MNIVLLIESLGSGGAERQMCVLAAELKRRGHNIQVVTYAPGNFYTSFLESNGIKHVFLGGTGTLEWAFRIRKFLRTNRQDVVLAFLGSCASYAELASLPFRHWGLVVSERIAAPRFPRGGNRLRKKLHLLADVVTTNSHTNRLMLEASVSALKSRILTVYNAVDLEIFKPGRLVYNPIEVKLVTAARFDKQKNVLRAIEAFDLVRKQNKDISISVDWFGNTTNDVSILRSCVDVIKQKKLEDNFRIHEPTQDIISRYQQADAVWLPSLYEGLPNTVCEGMACGKPILMSAVCDAGNLVKEGENGFLFSPEDPSDIAKAINKFISLNEVERLAMGYLSRKMAEQYFYIGKIADMYESILNVACLRQRLDCKHWLPNVPQTAFTFIKSAKDESVY